MIDRNYLGLVCRVGYRAQVPAAAQQLIQPEHKLACILS
jgi:hypothetical protein